MEFVIELDQFKIKRFLAKINSYLAFSLHERSLAETEAEEAYSFLTSLKTSWTKRPLLDQDEIEYYIDLFQRHDFRYIAIDIYRHGREICDFRISSELEARLLAARGRVNILRDLYSTLYSSVEPAKLILSKSEFYVLGQAIDYEG